MSNIRLLERKVCLITETSRGIGRTFAERYAEEGAIVYANARKTGSIDELSKECSLKNQRTVSPVYFDLTDYVAVKQSVLRIMKGFVRFSGTVLNKDFPISE